MIGGPHAAVRRRLGSVIVTAAIVVVACGGGDGLEAYYERLATIGREQNTGSANIVAAGSAPTREQIREIVDLRRSALDELQSIEPPDDVAGLHREFVGSLERLVTLAESFLRDSATMSPQDFTVALSSTTEIDEAQRRFTAFCRTLEFEADGLGVGPVDLSC